MAIVAPHPHADQVKMASGLDAVAGLWLLVSAWVVPMTTEMAWSNAIVGILVAIMACVRAFGAYGAAGLSWVNVALGFWVLISPWVLEVETAPSAWNGVITGLVIIALAAWSAIATNTEHTDRTEPPAAP